MVGLDGAGHGAELAPADERPVDEDVDPQIGVGVTKVVQSSPSGTWKAPATSVTAVAGLAQAAVPAVATV